MKSNSKNFLKGEYVFYKDGVEVLRSPNIITNEGKEIIINYLSRQNSDYASRIILGCGTSTPAATDTFMHFELFPTAVDFRTVDFTQTPTQIVFRTTLPAAFKGVIYESGLSTTGGVNLSSLDDVNDNPELTATFDPNFEGWATSTGVAFHTNDLEGTPRLRAGAYGLEFTVSGTGSKESTWTSSTPIDYYTDSDKIKVAFHVSGAVPNSLIIKFIEDETNYYMATIPASSMVVGYNIVTLSFSSLVKTGAPEIQNTSSISVAVITGALPTVTTMDSIRFDKNSDVNKPTLVSRSLLTTPLVVEGGVPFDVEYRLGFSI